MAFRDDHDAAIARIDALEGDLQRLEAERDRLKAELARERNDKPAAKLPRPPTQALVHQPMTPGEIDALVDDVHEAALRTETGRRLGIATGCVLTFAIVIVALSIGQPVFLLGALVTMIGVVLRAATTNNAEAVIADIRNAPEQIVDVTRLVSRRQLRPKLLVRTTDNQVILTGKRLFYVQERLLRRRLDAMLK